ncbi:glycosyltransferase 87 family protein [Arthrobacter tecti]
MGDQLLRARGLRRLSIIGSLAAVVLGLIAVIMIAKIHGLDFHVYRQGAVTLLEAGGTQLYDPVAVDTASKGLPFTYPPFAALLFTPLALIPGSAGLTLMTLISCACLVAISFIVVNYLGKSGSMGSLAGTSGKLLAVALATLLIGITGPWREGLGFGQINSIIMLLIVVDLVRPPSRIPRGALIGLAAGIKLTPLAFGLIFLARGDWRSILTMGATFAGTIAIGWLVLPVGSGAFWLDALLNPERVGDTDDMYNVSINSLLAHLHTPEDLHRVIWLLLCAALIAVGFIAIRKADSYGDVIAAISANAIVMLAISPISWFHHWVWIALIIPALYVTARRRTGWARAVGLGLAVIMLPTFMMSSMTLTLLLNGSTSGQGPMHLEVISGTGLIQSLVALAYWAAMPRSVATPSVGARTPVTFRP